MRYDDWYRFEYFLSAVLVNDVQNENLDMFRNIVWSVLCPVFHTLQYPLYQERLIIQQQHLLMSGDGLIRQSINVPNKVDSECTELHELLRFIISFLDFSISTRVQQHSCLYLEFFRYSDVSVLPQRASLWLMW